MRLFQWCIVMIASALAAMPGFRDADPHRGEAAARAGGPVGAPTPPPPARLPPIAPAPPYERLPPPVAPPPAPPIASEQVHPNLVARFDEIIAYDAQKWSVHRFVRGSVRNVRYTAGSLDTQTFIVAADYDFYEFGRLYTGWARLKVRNGKLECIEYWNAPCRPAHYSRDGIDRKRMPGDRGEEK